MNGQASGSQDELTKPLQLEVPRRVTGSGGSSRAYTLPLDATVALLTIDLSGSGDASFVVKDAQGKTRCTTGSSGPNHTCHLKAPAAGTWQITVSFGSDFSGTLVASASAVDAGSDGGSADAGTDGGAGDGGVVDGGPADAGVDGGSGDAGSGDAGSADGGHGARNDGENVSVHTTLGLADDARVGDLQRWLLVKPQYVISFNTTTKTPNWVSWQLNQAWLGSASRSSSFKADADLPSSAPQAGTADYDLSGYARGHMCPSSDRTDTAADNLSTFVYTNVVPQLQSLNNGTWKSLETEERQLVAAGKTLFITAGPIRGSATIGNGVNVPSATWKVIVVFDGPATAASVTTATRVIAVIMNNDGSVSGAWTTYRTTVREIEARTGLDLLSDVATDVQDAVETRVDDGPAQ